MDPVAWGAFPDAGDAEDDRTCEAAELGEREGRLERRATPSEVPGVDRDGST